MEDKYPQLEFRIMHWIIPFGKQYFLVILTFLSLIGCKGLVEQYDQRLLKKFDKMGFQEKFLDKNGHHIHYFDNERKNAPVLFFVHGFGGDGKVSWQYQVKEFEKDYRVIVHDILWFGESTSDHTPSLKAQIDALHTLKQELNVEDLNLVGISYGGFIVLGYTFYHRDEVNSLTIVDSPGNSIKDEEIDAFCEEIGVEDIQEAFVLKDGDGVKRLLRFSFYKPPKLPGFILNDVHEKYFSQNHKEQKLLLDELPENRSKLNGISELNVPSLILWGEEDIIFGVDKAKSLRDSLDAELEIFPKAGHALPGEKEKEFNKRLKTFLNKYNQPY